MPTVRDVTPAYENALRAIGRHLDSETAYHARVLEVEDGFTVQFQSSPNHADGHSAHFPWERLQDLLIFNSAGRGVGGKRKRHLGLWADVEGGRENLYRAMGNKLDTDGASAVSVDELPDGVALSFMSVDPQDALLTDKHHLVLTLDDMRALQAEAQHRRGSTVRQLFPEAGTETTAV